MEKKLPKGWVYANIGEIAEVNSGIGFPVALQGKNEGEIPFYKVADISQTFLRREQFMTVANNYIDETELKLLKGKLFQPGAIVFAKIGEALRLNRRAILNKAALVDNNVMGITPIKYEMVKYLYYFMTTQNLAKYSAGNAVPSIRKSIVLEIETPLPPLAEQKRIVAKLDTLFASLENTKIRLEKIPVLVKNFKQAVLTQAVTGKLTEQWRDGKELEEWKKFQFIELANKIFDGPFGSNLKTQDYTAQGVLVVRLENLGFMKFHENKQSYISEEKYLQLERHTLLENDILIASFIADEVRVTLFPKLGVKAINKADCFCVRLNEQIVDHKFCLYLLSSSEAKNYLKNIAHGMTRLRFNLTQLKSLPINLPLLEEQTEIVRCVESIFAKVDAIEQQYQSLKQKIDTLPQAILAKAFSGELVEQNPLDEPASDLLERIRSLRETEMKRSKTKKGRQRQ